MDFFARQDQARRKSHVLVLYFVAAVVLIILTIHVAMAFAFIFWMDPDDAAGTPDLVTNLPFLGGVTLGVLVVISLGTLYKIMQLRAGGSAVAEMLGGRQVAPNTTDLKEKRLLNVVEEMAIASGVPIPPVYVLDKEPAINAFAAGFRPSSAVVAVTRGTLDQLNREELQGVVAHEFSHILNGDMGLNIRLMGVLHGILLIALIGELLLRTTGGSRSSKKKGNGLALAGLALLVVGWIGVFFGRLIKSAVARQREFLADASAVQFTRYPEGLSGALKKIGGLSAGSRIQSPQAEQASHLFFGNALRSGFFNAMATHPPLEERIRRLDPQFDGKFSRTTAAPAGDDESVAALAPSAPRVTAPRAATPLASRMAEGLGARGFEMILNQIGNPLKTQVATARRILEDIPADVREAARAPDGARALVYALLLSRDPDVRARQWQLLAARVDPAQADQVKRLEPSAASLTRQAYLPLVDLAANGLRDLSQPQSAEFRELVQALVAADQQVDLFEMALLYTLFHRLDARQAERPRALAQIYSVRGLVPECSCLLSALARAGHADEAAARQAFQAAAPLLGEPGVTLTLLPADQCGALAMGKALDKVDHAAPRVKKAILAASLQCIGFDQQVTESEAELFRVLACALDCPMPPWYG